METKKEVLNRGERSRDPEKHRTKGKENWEVWKREKAQMAPATGRGGATYFSGMSFVI